MGRKLTSWPAEAGEYVEQILARLDYLDAVIVISLQEGFKNHNREWLKQAYVMMLAGLQEIAGASNQLEQIKEASGLGRLTAWGKMTTQLYDTIGLMQGTMDEYQAYYRQRNWPAIRVIMVKFREVIAGMRVGVTRIPFTATAVQEAEEIVRRAQNG